MVRSGKEKHIRMTTTNFTFSRIVLLFIISVIFIQHIHAQKQYQVFGWKSEYTLNIFLQQQMRRQYAQRESNLQEALRSRERTKAYRDSCRARYKRLLGALPPRTPLNAHVTKIIPQQGYRVEALVYESIPGHHVTANLYIPEGNGPFPGLLLFCGHENESKATISYQKTAILFALNGFVTLVIDPISQSERYQLTDRTGKPSTRGGTTEHTLVNAAASLVGNSAAAYSLWDNIRGLDYLETRREVDRERLGCLGNSGGGTQTTYFIGFDDRIKVAAVCSYIASRERNFELFGPNDGCQHMLSEGENHIEINDFLIMFAPKPLIILAGRYDFVDYIGTQAAYEETRLVYQTLGAAQNIRLFTFDDGHGISKPKREATVTWFRKWLYQDSTKVREGELMTLTEQDLTSTQAAQVNAAFPDEKDDFERTKEIADHYKKARTENKSLERSIRTVNRIGNDESPIEFESVGKIEREGMVMNRIIVRRRGSVPLALLTLYPGQEAKQVILWLHGDGKHRVADSTLLLKKYLSEQSIVLLADVSGIGEMKDPAAHNDPKYFSDEYRNAMMAIHIGQSLPSIRTADIMTLIRFINDNPTSAGLPIHVYASGSMALPALQAAVLDHRITRLFTYRSIRSFYEAIDTPLRKNHYSYVIPDVLKYYDIPDLRKFLVTRLTTN